MSIRWNLLPLTLILTATNIATAQTPFDNLLRRVPSGANAVMVIDVSAVHSSPLAVREGWKDQHEAEYVKRPLVLPPEAERIVIASQMNYNQELRQDWELAVMSLTEEFSMRAVARAEGGYVDDVDGKPAAWTPSDAYFVTLESKVLGVMHPANRQAVGRWVDFSDDNKQVVASEYLKSAAAAVNQQTPIVMALDLKGVVRPHNLQESLMDSDLTRDNPAKQKAWFDVIMDLEGVTLSVQLGEKAQGIVASRFLPKHRSLRQGGEALGFGSLEQIRLGA